MTGMPFEFILDMMYQFLLLEVSLSVRAKCAPKRMMHGARHYPHVGYPGTEVDTEKDLNLLYPRV